MALWKAFKNDSDRKDWLVKLNTIAADHKKDGVCYKPIDALGSCWGLSLFLPIKRL